jgi:hypothetical protein
MLLILECEYVHVIDKLLIYVALLFFFALLIVESVLSSFDSALLDRFLREVQRSGVNWHTNPKT